MKGCFVGKSGSDRIEFVFAHARKEAFARRLELCPDVIHEENLEAHKAFLRETEVIIATWGMEAFSHQTLEKYFPNLKLVLYAAGSVQYFARPFLERGIRICSAWGSMCYPVAQFTFSCIVFANKGALRSAQLAKAGKYQEGHVLSTMRYPGSYEGTKVGILGAGKIGTRVIEMLRPMQMDVLLFDPFCSEERASEMGVTLTSLEAIFSQCQTISNHIADHPQTRGMLDYRLFSKMKPDATFINTGRGAQVVEKDLIRALEEEPARFAYLDVTYPEPVEEGHPFLSMPNVVLFPHIAGYAEREVLGMADLMLSELAHYQKGEALEFEVTLPMLQTMA